MPRVAFHTQAPALGPRTDPVMEGFTDRIEGAFDSAHNTDGFIGRISDLDGDWIPGDRSNGQDPDMGDPGVSMDSRTDFYAEYESVPSTLTVWEDLESVAAFAYRGLHAEALSKRREWFVETKYPVYVAWWVDDDAPLPAWNEAGRRLTHLHDHGPTSKAFDFKSLFDASGSPVRLDRNRLNKYAETVR